MIFTELNENNFILFAAKVYDYTSCIGIDDFKEDIKRFDLIKRAFKKYRLRGRIKERHVLNNLIVIYNMFGIEATTMLIYKLYDYIEYLKPFLILLNKMPECILKNGIWIYSKDIDEDKNIVMLLRNI